jgi:hypothetical protein
LLEGCVRLALQIVVRHVNFVQDKMKEKKSMGTERMLFVLDDLARLKLSLRGKVAMLIHEKIVEVTGNWDLMADQTILPLM